MENLVQNQLNICTRAIRSFTSVQRSYGLRDIGPAGGLYFINNGDDYLEAASSNQSTNQPWSNIDFILG
jgi:hypothetical protein